jgi:hypothetical protein
MAVDERIASYSDKELANLRENIVRLAESGSAKQKAEAERLMPLVDAERAERKSRAPEKPARKAPAKKAKTAKV